VQNRTTTIISDMNHTTRFYHTTTGTAIRMTMSLDQCLTYFCHCCQWRITC